MLNQVTLIGRLGRNPELRKTNAGKSICNLRLATTETYTKDGERKEKTEWHTVVIFADKLADAVAKHAGKGDLLAISGKLQTRKWEKDGVDRYSTEVVVDFGGTVRFLTPKKESGANRGDAGGEDLSDLGNSGADIDDEIPF